MITMIVRTACGLATMSCGCWHRAIPRPADMTPKTRSCPKGVPSGLTGQTVKGGEGGGGGISGKLKEARDWRWCLAVLNDVKHCISSTDTCKSCSCT